MNYTYNNYRPALINARELEGLPEENYFMYVESKSGNVEFSSNDEKRAGWTGYFVEDDERIPGILSVASKRVRIK